MIIAMHQPNFFPWFPYFHRMGEADKFIIVKEVQFNNYLFQKRFHFDGRWHSMQVKNRKKLDAIKNKSYDTPKESWDAIKRQLPAYADILGLFDNDIKESVFTTNVNIIKRIKIIFGITTEIVYDYPTELTSTERLVDLMKYHGGTTFLAGPSADNYVSTTLFDNAGIHIEPHRIDPDLKIPTLLMLREVLG